MKNRTFQHASSLRPGRSQFDLSYEKIFSGDLGYLYPVMCDEVVPGDIFEITNECVIRFMPMVAPILHEINVYFHYFFVPNRILWNEKTNDETSDTGTWEEFITGGEDGTSTPTLVKWDPAAGDTDIGKLWDYLGLPTSCDDPLYVEPVDFPRRAYNTIWNTYYRDENLISEVSIQNVDILKRSWEKDYFTSALPWQQRGTAPALPIAGTSSAVWDTGKFIYQVGTKNYAQYSSSGSDDNMYLENSTARQNAEDHFNDNTVDLSMSSTFDIADLRLAFQIQKWMERNARAGARYTEFLKSHFGVSPRDERLQRPEYIGGSKQPVIVSEVLQTSSTDVTSPQGNLAGHAIGVNQQYAGKYRAKEFGIIMGLMSVMPKPVYQQGIDRQWLKDTKYDYYFPEFANLSEQVIYNGEIYVTNAPASYVNVATFGFQGRYDELRTKRNMVCGLMRSDFDHWHLSRQFSSLPTLNETFIQCTPRKDFLATPSEPAFVATVGNIIKAFRPIPITAEPGLVDH